MLNIKKELVELRKSGKFYNSFGDDAIILHYLMGYKIVSEKGGVGFPETAFNKVINKLKDEEVSYIVYDKENIVLERNFKKLNRYSTLLKKGLKEISIEERFKNIEKRINELNIKELEHILTLIEDAIS